jgi:hypothetical protein
MKFLGKIDEPKDLVTKAQTDALDTRITTIENNNASIFTTNSDDFLDNTKIQTNVNLVRTDGIIRSTITKYEENFSNSVRVDEDKTDNNITVSGGSAYVTSSTLGIGYVPTDAATQNEYKFQTLSTEVFDLTGATEVRLTPTFTNNTPLTGYTSPVQRGVSSGTSLESVFKTYKDSNNNIWNFCFSIGSGSPSILKYTVNGGSEITVFNNGTYTTLQSDTSRRILSVTETSSQVLVAYPISTTQYGIRYINKSDFSLSSLITVNMVTTTIAIQRISILQNGNRLHILASNSNGATNRNIVYAFTDTVSNVAIADNNYFIRYASPFIYGVKLISIGGTKVGWCGFTAQSTLGVHFGIIDETVGTFPHQFRTLPVAQAAAFPYNAVGCATVTSNCNGNGAMAYDSVNSCFYLMWGISSGSQAQFAKINAGATDAMPTISSITATPFDTFGNRDCDIYLSPVSTTFPRTMDVFFSEGLRSNIYQAKMSVTSGGVFTISSYNHLYRTENASASKIYNIDVIPLTGAFHTVYFNDDSLSKNISYTDGIKPLLRAMILREGNSTSTKVELTSGSSATVSVGINVTNIYIKYEYYYPILSASFSGTNYSARIQSYTLERTLPIPSASSGNFISTPLITDRIVKSVTLNATQTVPTITGNSIVWEVRALNNGTWRTITNGSTHTFATGEEGSYLQVKGTLAYGATATSLSQVPLVDSYSVTVTNTITQNDLLPLQINLMKLGVNVTALITANRYNYKNMMIDTFETSNGVQNLNGLTHSNNNGTLTNNTGGNITVVTQIETADITATNLTLVAEYTGTMTFRVSRDGGTTWYAATKETITPFTGSESPKNQIVLESTFYPSASCAGWAYLYA